MAKKVWTFTIKDSNHVVILKHGTITGGRDISVDGVPLSSSSKLWDTGSVHNFEIAGVPCVLQIQLNTLTYNYNLFVDGKFVNPTS